MRIVKKNKKQTIIYILFALAFFSIVIGFLFITNEVQARQKNEIRLSQHYSENNFYKEDFYVQITKTPDWEVNEGFRGAQYNGVIVNRSNYDLMDWMIEVKVPEESYLDGAWYGIYAKDGKILKITPVSYNYRVKKNSDSTTFGYLLYTPSAFEVEDVVISVYMLYEKEDFPLYWGLIIASVILTISFISYVLIEIRVKRYKLMEVEDKRIILQSLKTFANFIDAKDPYTKGHSTRVAIYTREMAKRMGFKEHELDIISYIALMHDVGKIGTRDAILNKAGTLTAEEWKMIQLHTTTGGEILKDFTAIEGIADGAKYHHEKYDGTGYPKGLAGKEIPLYARIICIADAYDAMSSNRCYRIRLSDEEIVAELITYSGKQFDPELVVYMMEMINDGFIEKNRNEESIMDFLK